MMAPLRRTKSRVSGPYDSNRQKDSDEQVGSVSVQLPPGPSSPFEYADPSYLESKLVEDIISKEEHERLDNNLRFTCWAYGDEDTFSRGDARMLLLLLVVEGCEHLDLKFTTLNPRQWESVVQLFRTHPWLVPVMEKCWTECSFRTIRRLGEY